FAEPGTVGNTKFETLGDAISQLVNSFAATFETMGERKLAKPLGIKDGKGPLPGAVESRFSNHAIDDLRANLAGLHDAYHGRSEGMGLSVLLSDRRPDLDAAIRDGFAVCGDLLSAYETPLGEAIYEDVAGATQLRDCIVDLRTLFTTEVAALLSVTIIELTDNDGD
ncbi:MAG: hypothetical protein GY910_08205, partial [bacterium]|nr:hypothetical protein [bacterium]